MIWGSGHGSKTSDKCSENLKKKVLYSFRLVKYFILFLTATWVDTAPPSEVESTGLTIKQVFEGFLGSASEPTMLMLLAQSLARITLGYIFFVKEFRRQMERKGHKYNGLEEVIQDPECSAAWRSTSPEDKAFYKQMEKEEKENPTMDLGRKFRKDKLTGLGESLNKLERAEMERNRFRFGLSATMVSLNSSLRSLNLSPYSR